MCGIIGVFNIRGGPCPAFDIEAALASLHHRGPDDRGHYRQGSIVMGATRLAIIDPAAGHQPVHDEAGRYHAVLNGEIYDYDQILADLKAGGHFFRSRCDTEVACHLFEQYWTDALDKIDGQYALAVFDSQAERLLLVRDRMGICPLFYAIVGDSLVFASEMKAIFATGLVRPQIDPRSLDSVAALGNVPAPRSMFVGVKALPPGHFLEAREGRVNIRAYWDIPYPCRGGHAKRPIDQAAAELRDLLTAACKRRLKADVPVGLYLSGGIDSASIATMVANEPEIRKRVFSIAFRERGFDEQPLTAEIADFLGLQTQFLLYPQKQLADDLPKLVYHAESPILSTESVPLMALSGLARQHVKVVLTGEGSDEAMGGYIYFRWDALRNVGGEGLWDALIRTIFYPMFRLGMGPRNPFVPQRADRRWAQEVFGYCPGNMMKFLYFRIARELTYSDDMWQRQAALSDAELVDLPRDHMRTWDLYDRSLYVSSRVFMTGYLLGAHGDRALMAHSVEGRYPFLDRTVQEYLATVPSMQKTTWMHEKILLRRAMAGRLPAHVVKRKKKAFLAPFGTPFVGDNASDLIRELLSPTMLKRYGYFDPAKIARLVSKMEQVKQTSNGDRETFQLGSEAIARTVAGMALTFAVSTQILAHQVATGAFTSGAASPAAAAVEI